MQLIVLLGAKDEDIRDHFNKSLENKYTSHDIQNESQKSWPTTCYVKKLKKLKKMRLFLLWAAYISSKEQFSLSLQFAKENLEVQKDFLGFH